MTRHGNWPVVIPPEQSEEWELYEQMAAPGDFAWCGGCADSDVCECDQEPEAER